MQIATPNPLTPRRDSLPCPEDPRPSFHRTTAVITADGSGEGGGVRGPRRPQRFVLTAIHYRLSLPTPHTYLDLALEVCPRRCLFFRTFSSLQLLSCSPWLQSLFHWWYLIAFCIKKAFIRASSFFCAGNRWSDRIKKQGFFGTFFLPFFI